MRTGFLAAVAAAVALSLGHPGTDQTASAALKPMPFQLRLGALAHDGPPPEASLSIASVFQGGAFLVRVSEGVSGSVSLFGRSYPLQPSASGLAGFVGIGTEDPPGPVTVTVDFVTSYGEQQQLLRTVTVKKTQWTVDYIVIPPDPGGGGGDGGPPLENEQPRLDALYTRVSPRLWRDTWVAPVPGPVTPEMISGYFGEQRSFNGGPVQGHHGGTDFGVSAGTPVYASNDGVVVLSGLYLIRGNLIVVDHGGGVLSAYGHLSERLVSEGDVVKQGQLIGRVGSTGLSTGPHLHWELSVAGVLVDGLRWLDGTQGF